MDEEIILTNSPEAAQHAKHISGWVSRHGIFFGKDERSARYNGCTHVKCDCGKPVDKGRLACSECWERKAQEAYDKKPKAEKWEYPIYSDNFDKYFWDEDQVRDFCDGESDDIEKGIKDLRLLTCIPVLAGQIDPWDYYHEDLPEDADDVPKELREAFDRLNEDIRDCEIPLSWRPGKEAVVLEMED